MEEKKTRKTDRRTRYTRMVIKDALLELLEEKEYMNITVADLCRAAELSRGTFYLHYSNISQVMEETLDDVLANTHSVLLQVGCEITRGKKCSYPLCHFLRENKKYQNIFFADSLRSHVIDRMMNFSKDQFSERLQTDMGCSEDILYAIYYFQLNGCLALCKRYRDISDEKWIQIQHGVDCFLKAGFQNL